METLEQLIHLIQPLDQKAMQQAKARIDGLLKPIGSLGRLESLAVQMAGIYRSASLKTGRKEIIVMAADHAVFDEGIAVTPKAVTAIQAYNMTKGRGLTGVCALAYVAGLTSILLMLESIAIVEQAIAVNKPDPEDGVDILAKVGGFDLVGMTGTMLGGAAAGVPIVLDGFLSYACALVACKICPAVWHYLIPSHLSAEKGSQIALAHLDLKPFLQLDMRLGEGSGAAIAMHIIDAAISMYNRMGLLVDDNLTLPDPS